MTQGEITLYIACSVDGFIATNGGGVSWLDEFDDHYEEGVSGGSYEQFFKGVDCLVIGSHTYEQVLTFGDWPYDERPTYVTTHRELPRENEYVEFYSGDLEALVDGLRDEYESIWLVGGATLAQEFLASGLLNQIWLSVVPVLLGDGVPLFGSEGSKHDLHLENVIPYETGITEVRYAVTERKQH